MTLLVDDALVSATKLGNDTSDTARTNVISLYKCIRDATPEQLLKITETWQAILSGEREAVCAVQKVFKHEFPLHMLGDFKIYFVAKCLRTRYTAMHVKPVVGSNLKPDREHGAFQSLYAVRLASNLCSSDLDILMDNIHRNFIQKLISINEAPLASMVDVEITEHACCESQSTMNPKMLQSDPYDHEKTTLLATLHIHITPAIAVWIKC